MAMNIQRSSEAVYPWAPFSRSKRRMMPWTVEKGPHAYNLTRVSIPLFAHKQTLHCSPWVYWQPPLKSMGFCLSAEKFLSRVEHFFISSLITRICITRIFFCFALSICQIACFFLITVALWIRESGLGAFLHHIFMDYIRKFASNGIIMYLVFYTSARSLYLSPSISPTRLIVFLRYEWERITNGWLLYFHSDIAGNGSFRQESTGMSNYQYSVQDFKEQPINVLATILLVFCSSRIIGAYKPTFP